MVMKSGDWMKTCKFIGAAGVLCGLIRALGWGTAWLDKIMNDKMTYD